MLFNKFEGRKHSILNVREQSIKHGKSGRIIVVVVVVIIIIIIIIIKEKK